jgi:hypothetical protein
MFYCIFCLNLQMKNQMRKHVSGPLSEFISCQYIAATVLCILATHQALYYDSLYRKCPACYRKARGAAWSF